MSKGIGWSIYSIREKVKEIIATGQGYAPIFLTIKIKKVSSKDDVLIVNGSYDVALLGERGEFHLDVSSVSI